MEDLNTQNQKTEKNNSEGLGAIFIGIIVFSVAFIISAILVSNSISSLRSDRTITVKGYAEMNITSDFATWTGNITTHAVTLADGYVKMQKYKARVERYLLANGFSKDSIEFQTLGSSENYEYFQGAVSRRTYRFHQNFTISSYDVNKIKNVSNQITELIGEGIEINSWAPQYTYTKLNDLKGAMLRAATQDAKTRAEEIAKSGGNKIGSILSASQGIFQITAPNSNEISDYGINDMTSIEKTIKSVVTVRYSIK